MSFWGARGWHFYCLFHNGKALDLWFLSQFSQIVHSDPPYFIKRKMKGIRYISTVLHYSSCMKRQSKMAALHAAICTLNYSNAFFSLFIVWWCLNQLKQIKVGNKLIEFLISLAENLIQNSCRFASPSPYEDFQGGGSDASESPKFYRGSLHFRARVAILLHKGVSDKAVVSKMSLCRMAIIPCISRMQ